MNHTKARAREIVSIVLPLLLLLAQNKALAQYQLRNDGVNALGGVLSSASNNLQAVAGQPYPIGTFSSPNHILNAGAISELGAVASHRITLAAGWNPISSYLAPANPNLPTVLAAILPQMELMKNGTGKVFWPAQGLNTIGDWEASEGYQINMLSATELTITGEPVATPIALAEGWNLTPYLCDRPMKIETALAGIAEKIVMVKNNAGQVYAPELGVNQIGEMRPGQAYQIQVHTAATLIYPSQPVTASHIIAAKARVDRHQAIDGEEAEVIGGNEATKRQETVDRQKALGRKKEIDVEAPRHYSSSLSHTGANATVLIEAKGLADGDEIAVHASNHKLVGSGVVRQGKALLTIWGDNDNDLTKARNKEAVKGAGKGEALLLEVWSSAEQKKKTLAFAGLTDALTGEPHKTLKYQTDAVLLGSVSEVTQLPTAFSLAQNYPNPFNPSTIIKYGLPQEARVKLEIFDMLGRRVAVLVDAQEKAGYHEVFFENASLSSGVYFYQLQAGTFNQKRKMMLVR